MNEIKIFFQVKSARSEKEKEYMKFAENAQNSVTILKFNVRFFTTDIFACRDNCDLRYNGLIRKGRAWLP